MQHTFEKTPKNGWQLFWSYWGAKSQRRSAMTMLAAMVVLTVVLVGFDVVFTYWMRYFYNALQNYDKHGIIDLIKIFLFLAGIYIILAVNRFYLQQYLGLRWRRWLTQQFLGRWLSHRNYYYLESFVHNTDNPDQRICDDVREFVYLSLSLAIGLLSAVTTLCAFIYILWDLSRDITIPLGSYGNVYIPGYLVWAALIYAVIGTWLTLKIGGPLVSLRFEQQRREANFRFSAINIRSHAEHIALFRGEASEEKNVGSIFERVLENWYLIILREKLLLWFTAGYNQISVIFPILVCLPGYLNKAFQLGGFMQILNVFGKIETALSFIVHAYATIAEWQAIKRRLLFFLQHMVEVEEKVEHTHCFDVTKQAGFDIALNNLTINKPNEETLLSDFSYQFTHGHHYLIKGSSGVGKSTLIRAVAGIWPFGAGSIALPETANIMYLPQKPYMPLGSLRQAVLFPAVDEPVDDDTIKQALTDCHLPHLTERLAEVAMWSQVLSPGEQQRLSFARILIQKPDWAILDESTSALDYQYEQDMYQQLKSVLPNCSLISVGHRETLSDYHTDVLVLSPVSV